MVSNLTNRTEKDQDKCHAKLFLSGQLGLRLTKQREIKDCCVWVLT